MLLVSFLKDSLFHWWQKPGRHCWNYSTNNDLRKWRKSFKNCRSLWKCSEENFKSSSLTQNVKWMFLPKWQSIRRIFIVPKSICTCVKLSNEAGEKLFIASEPQNLWISSFFNFFQWWDFTKDEFRTKM